MILLTTASAALGSGGVLAASLKTPSNSTNSLSDIEPGVLGFLVVAVMGVALVFLLRSMNKQFRKIGPKPEDDVIGLAELAELARQPDGELEEAPAPSNVVEGTVLPEEAREDRAAKATRAASQPSRGKRTAR